MKSQIPSTKLQINYKFQYPMTKTCLELSYFKIMYRFGILKLGTRAQGGESNRSADNVGHCDLEFLVSPADCRKRERVSRPPQGQSKARSLGPDSLLH
jgi:hypothetical protein